MTDHQAIFTPQYAEKSGPGSTLEFSKPYRQFIERFIIEHSVKSIVDLGCGDLEIMSNVDLHGAVYVGVDVIEERVQRNRLRFPHLAIEHNDLRSAITRADLVLCKDVIQHWSTDDIVSWLIRLDYRSFKYALITNCCYGEVNSDIKTGGWRAIDLTKAPFGVGEVVFSWGTPNKDVVLLKGGR